jgi:hypothetical protein
MADPTEPTSRRPTVIRIRRPIRILYFLSVASSFALFACAGCCYLFSWFIRPEITEDPKAAVEVAGSIATWTLPPGFAGKSTVKMDNLLMKVDIAKFEQERGRGFLVVGRVAVYWMQTTPADQAQKIRDQIIEQQVPDLKKIDARDPSTRTVTINGETAELQVVHGEDRASTTKYWQVTGHFRSNHADGFLILQCEDEFLTQAQIDAFLDSLK